MHLRNRSWNFVCCQFLPYWKDNLRWTSWGKKVNFGSVFPYYEIAHCLGHLPSECVAFLSLWQRLDEAARGRKGSFWFSLRVQSAMAGLSSSKSVSQATDGLREQWVPVLSSPSDLQNPVQCSSPLWCGHLVHLSWPGRLSQVSTEVCLLGDCS